MATAAKNKKQSRRLRRLELRGSYEVLPKRQYIKQFQYGLGVTTEFDEQRTSVDFEIHGMKKSVTSLMVVDPAEGRPPERPHRKRSKKPAVTLLATETEGAK